MEERKLRMYTDRTEHGQTVICMDDSEKIYTFPMETLGFAPKDGDIFDAVLDENGALLSAVPDPAATEARRAALSAQRRALFKKKNSK